VAVELGPEGIIGAVPIGRGYRDALELRWRRPVWMRDALCREHPEVNFHPDRGERTEPAKAVCERCPVRAACLEHALANREHDGIWGGMSPRERRAIARLRRAS
jgi:WhiB family redox-sensing transcriptional regulator